jgi:molybdopterin-guanine dinucleotide biosynthesis protein
MRTVFLITGFQNWGKTWLINELFKRKRFYKNTFARRQLLCPVGDN